MTNSESPLTYKGVVFNEMKGAMSSPISSLWQAFSSELYPTNTYHYNSGGEPEDIPDFNPPTTAGFSQKSLPSIQCGVYDLWRHSCI